MKILNYLTSAVLLLFAFTACTSSPESDQATTSEAREVAETTGEKTLTIDTANSTIEWIGTKVSGYHVGTIDLKEGEIYVENGEITSGRFVMNMQSLAVTGPEGSNPQANEKLRGHLMSEDFFHVDQHPDAVFEITEVKPYTGGAINEPDDPRQADISKYKVSDPTHTVGGNLTIRGETKHIEFPAKITLSENAGEAVAKFNINRKDWNITYPGNPDDLIRDEIHLGISLRATESPM